MLVNRLRKNIRDDLECPPELRTFGSGWISGTAALVIALAGLCFVLCLRYPTVLSIPALRDFHDRAWFRLGVHVVLIAAFLLSAVSLVLRSNKVLGFAAITITLFATILGGSRVHASGVGELTGGFFLGLDWFILNLIFTGLLFVPLESLFARNREQPLFRDDWREDIFYFLISSLLVQVLTFLSLRPSLMILSHTHWTSFRSWVGVSLSWSS